MDMNGIIDSMRGLKDVARFFRSMAGASPFFSVLYVFISAASAQTPLTNGAGSGTSLAPSLSGTLTWDHIKTSDLMWLREDGNFVANEVPPTWGAVSNGICCSLKVTNPTSTVAAGIQVELFFKNVSDKSWLLTNPYDLRGPGSLWILEMVGPKGPVEYQGGEVTYGLTLRDLKPGEVVRYVGTAKSPVWNLAETGNYVLKVKYTAYGPRRGDNRPIWEGTIDTRTAQVTLK